MSIWDEEAPSSGGKFLKLETGKTVRIRFYGDPIMFEKTFEEKPSVRFGALVLFRNGETRENEPKIFEFGWMIHKQIRALVQDEDWGSPKEYDLVIKRDGTGKETKYTVIPKPPKAALTDEEKQLIDDCDWNLNDILLGKDKANGHPSPDPDEYDPFGGD